MFQNKRYQQNQRAYREKGATWCNRLFIFIAKFFMIRPRTPLIFLEHSDPCAMGMKSILSISDVWFSFYFYCFQLPGEVIYQARIALFEKFNVYERGVCTMKLGFIYSIQIVLYPLSKTLINCHDKMQNTRLFLNF